MHEITLSQPDPTTLRSEIAPIILRARDLVVVDVETHRAAEEAIRDIRLGKRKIKEACREFREQSHKAWKAAVAFEARFIDPLDEAERLISGKADTYERDQRRIAEAEQHRLEAAARAAEEARLLDEAAAAEDAGDAITAAAIMQEADTMPLPVIHVAPAVAKVEGTSKQERWHAEVHDKPALDRYVAAHPECSDYTLPNMPSLNARARSAKGMLNIPGVRAVAETSRRVRS